MQLILLENCTRKFFMVILTVNQDDIRQTSTRAGQHHKLYKLKMSEISWVSWGTLIASPSPSSSSMISCIIFRFRGLRSTRHDSYSLAMPEVIPLLMSNRGQYGTGSIVGFRHIQEKTDRLDMTIWCGQLLNKQWWSSSSECPSPVFSNLSRSDNITIWVPIGRFSLFSCWHTRVSSSCKIGQMNNLPVLRIQWKHHTIDGLANTTTRPELTVTRPRVQVGG